MLSYIVLLISAFVCLECTFVVKVPDECDIERPCCFDDLPCIIREFRRRGWCDKEPEFPYKEKKLYIPKLDYSMAYFDINVAHTNIEFEDLTEGRIVELYINKKTGDSVLSIEFDDLEIKGDVVLRLARPKEEDIYITTQSFEKYDKVVTSSIIPAGPGREIIPLIKSRAFVSNLTYYNLGATIDSIKNEQVKTLFQSFLENKELAVQDLFRSEQSLDRPHVMACSFVENIICGSRRIKAHC